MPASRRSHSNSAPAASRMRTVASVMSGPMPSPGISVQGTAICRSAQRAGVKRSATRPATPAATAGEKFRTASLDTSPFHDHACAARVSTMTIWSNARRLRTGPARAQLHGHERITRVEQPGERAQLPGQRLRDDLVGSRSTGRSGASAIAYGSAVYARVSLRRSREVRGECPLDFETMVADGERELVVDRREIRARVPHLVGPSRGPLGAASGREPRSIGSAANDASTPPAVPCAGVTACACGAGDGLVAGDCVAAGRAQAAQARARYCARRSGRRMRRRSQSVNGRAKGNHAEETAAPLGSRG